jgi:glycosyltransferase involved in cell wall biosynthesis
MPEIFAKYDGRIPDAMKDIVRPILGYAGVVSRRVDLDLIAELGIKLPRCSIVLVGNILFPPEKLIKIKHKNIFLLGGKSYDELPNYMMNFDVCILPYIAVNHTSPPTKIYDYLATGKPVVSTYLPALECFSNLIKLVHTKEEFISFVNEALNENDQDIRKRRLEKAKENSWFVRANEIIGIIEEKLNRRKR